MKVHFFNARITENFKYAAKATLYYIGKCVDSKIVLYNLIYDFSYRKITIIFFFPFLLIQY